jgi:hypothetical protein
VGLSTTGVSSVNLSFPQNRQFKRVRSYQAE